MKKILLDFVNYIDSVLIQFVLAIIAALTGNLYFPTPQPTLAEITTALTEFQDAVTAVEDGGGVSERAIRDQKRDALLTLLRQLVLYLEMVSAGDLAKLGSTGFNLIKLPSPIGPLPKPVKFIAAPYQKGMLKLSLETIYGAKNYLFQYRLITETEWQNIPSTKTRIIIEGLQSGKEYICRVLPCGASEIKVYSDEVNSFVM